MGVLRSVVFSALMLGAACEQFKIPEVDAIVNHALKEHASYVHFSGNASSSVSKRASSYWYENIAHQGISAFGPGGYNVYRNVKDFGAKGDGTTDDTAAINNAILSGGRCGQGCSSSTTTPAVVYFPAGTYLISSSILDQYYTQLIGDPTNVPTLKATAGFSGFGLIDADKYYGANLNWGSTNVFFRQVRNFVLDMTAIPASNSATGIHWPTAQATSLQNIVFQMSAASGTQHVGVFCESGSAGFVTDLTFNGGKIGLSIGNQQFTMRNLVFNNCVTAIGQIWDWGWVYEGISINNCQVGIDMSTGGTAAVAVGSMILIDSSITNTPVGILTAFTASSTPPTAGSLVIENVVLNNVPTAVQLTGGTTVLAGTTGTTTIAGWGEGNEYTSSGLVKKFQGGFTPNARPASLLSGSKYYTRSKPQYQTLSASQFSSVRSGGARGNGVTDDTTALQNVINSATSAGKVVFFDAGTYLVTKTLTVPAGAKLVGEAYSVIMSSGSYFNDMANPKPVVQVGTPGSTGQVEWSDMIVSTQGTQAGAILIEWNLSTSGGTPSGIWDVHARIGGFTGSNLQVGQCTKTPTSGAVNTACIGAYMTMHITASASGLYLENVWLWTADHDIDDAGNTQLTIYNGRGLYIESTAGTFWLVGTAVEHHTLYQYQLANTQNIFMGYVQTETPYYQPNPIAPTPFGVVASLNDPNFATSCAGKSGNCADAWGLRIINSQNILIYGAGLYSFFNNYDATACSVGGGPENCQDNIVSLEGSLSNVNIYCLVTVGVTNMITQNGVTVALSSDNVNVYPDVIAIFKLASQGGGSVTKSSTSIPTTMSTSTIVGVSTTTSPTMPGTTGWTFLGCYTDNVGGRSLANGLQVPGGSGAMTIELCEATCKSAGYTLAGLEYSGECWCDNSFKNGGGPAPDGAAQCTMKCNGNTAETCGGPNRLDVYSYASATAPPTTTTTSTNPTPSGWNFKGCYTDNVGGRSLTHGMSVPGGAAAMTVEACETVCHAAGYILAGVEYAGECYCDNTIQNGGGPAPDGSAGCNMMCNGNSAETCGGPNRLDLYSYGTGNPATTSPAVAGKRGLAFNNATYANLFKGNKQVTWGYNWGYPSNGLDSSFEFVPMLWGLPSGADPGWTAAVQTAGTKNVLGFNEPDLGEQANVSPAAAAAGYATYMQPFAGTVKIGMPAVLWNRGPPAGMAWDSAFLGNCTGCELDFAPIHWYQNCVTDWFIGNVTQAWTVLQKPIWITEYQCYGTDAEQAAFLQTVIPWLDAQPYVARYAYFGVFPNYLLNADGTGLSLAGQAYANS